MSIRCFIAVELDSGIGRALHRVQDRFRRKLGNETSGIRWVQPERIHLTLKFLGDVDDTIIMKVCAVVDAAVKGVEPFDIEIADVGCFPPDGAARVLWVGVTAGSELLCSLQKKLDDELAELGFAPERRKFSAHLTLARIKQVRMGHRISELVQSVEPVFLGSQAVSSLTVFQSELTRTGPIYTAMHHGRFNA